jgi:serine/threonine-protein kinase
VIREEQIAADEALKQIDRSSSPVTGDEGKPLEKSRLRKSRPWKTSTGRIGIVLLIALVVFGGFVVWENLIGSLSPPPTPIATKTFSKDGMNMVYVPAGKFAMGSDDLNDTKPAHTVSLDAFWIDQTPITVRMYTLCVEAGRCGEPSEKGSETHSTYYGNRDFDNYPVIYVNWNMAKTYCEWVGRRLPTEAEWEKAARGEAAFKYPWGNNWPRNSLLNYNNAVGDTTEVGQYPNGASPYGALDMAGNVWEWVNDWWDESYYANSPAVNPVGPENGVAKILRGGSWAHSELFSRSVYRHHDVPTRTGSNYGFRCASSP